MLTGIMAEHVHILHPDSTLETIEEECRRLQPDMDEQHHVQLRTGTRFGDLHYHGYDFTKESGRESYDHSVAVGSKIKGAAGLIQMAGHGIIDDRFGWVILSLGGRETFEAGKTLQRRYSPIDPYRRDFYTEASRGILKKGGECAVLLALAVGLSALLGAVSYSGRGSIIADNALGVYECPESVKGMTPLVEEKRDAYFRRNKIKEGSIRQGLFDFGVKQSYSNQCS